MKEWENKQKDWEFIKSAFNNNFVKENEKNIKNVNDCFKFEILKKKRIEKLKKIAT